MNMVTRTSLVCFLAMSMMIFDGTLGRSTRQLRSTSCKDNGDCEYGNFCHYKFKKCRPVSNGCMLTVQQDTCMGIKMAEKGIEAMACDVATDDEKKQKKCHAGFKAFEEILEGSCNIALSRMCNPEGCPQNYHQPICKQKNSGLATWGGQ